MPQNPKPETTHKNEVLFAEKTTDLLHVCEGELRDLQVDIRQSVEGALFAGNNVKVVPTEEGYDFYEDGEYSRTYQKPEGVAAGIALAA